MKPKYLYTSYYYIIVKKPKSGFLSYLYLLATLWESPFLRGTMDLTEMVDGEKQTEEVKKEVEKAKYYEKLKNTNVGAERTL